MPLSVTAYVALATVASSVTALLYVYVWKVICSPTRDIPGPFWARFTRLWYLSKSYAGTFHHENIALHQRHGPVVRLAPDLFSIAAPDKAVYGVASRFEKSDWYETWKHPDPARWTLFADRDIKRHADTRRRVQNIYSMSALVSYEPSVDECNRIFHQRLSEFAVSGKTINLGHWLQCYAFDVIGDITFSKRFGFLDEGHDVGGIMEALHQSIIYSTCAGVYSWIHPYVYPVLERFSGSGGAGRTKLMNIVLKMIAERTQLRREKANDEKAGGKQQDFLDKIMDANEADPSKVTPAHVFVLGWSNINAGSDTTAVSLSSVLYQLTRNPLAMERLLAEIHHLRSQGKCTESRISFSETLNMPYLQACIKEGLRLHSATGLPIWRVVPKGGAEVCGRFFPEGSTVGINTWVAHYNEDVFGADAKQFRPERWLEASGDKLKTMEAYYMPFGGGSRTCLGRHISMLEMSKLLPVIVQNFEFELVDIEDEWDTINYWFVKPTNFKVRVQSRE